jgi:hypothetical protein
MSLQRRIRRLEQPALRRARCRGLRALRNLGRGRRRLRLAAARRRQPELSTTGSSTRLTLQYRALRAVQRRGRRYLQRRRRYLRQRWRSRTVRRLVKNQRAFEITPPHRRRRLFRRSLMGSYRGSRTLRGENPFVSIARVVARVK